MRVFHLRGVALATLLLLPVSTFGLGSTICFNQSILKSMDMKAVDDLLAQSNRLLEMSQNILHISEQMLADVTDTHIAYVQAMLRLSDDIGKMADRIGVMADRIITTEVQIGIMADRILQTQRIQNENIALTQANLLKAQENFAKILQTLAAQ
jgi:hypothetical protein